MRASVLKLMPTTLHHLVDLKTQLEVGLQFNGLTNKHVRGLVVSKSIEDEDFKAKLLKNGLEYLEMP